MQELIEGVHYYINDEGYMVFTARYLLERGYCCGNGCLHCPYNYENVPEPRKTELTLKPSRNKSGTGSKGDLEDSPKK